MGSAVEVNGEDEVQQPAIEHQARSRDYTRPNEGLILEFATCYATATDASGRDVAVVQVLVKPSRIL